MSLLHHTQRLLGVAALASAALLAGCAGVRTVDASVATHGAWPSDASPGTYAFEPLPAQQADRQQAQAMENAAAQALAAAGFRPAPEGSKPSVIVQVGERAAHFEQIPYRGDFWFRPRYFGYASLAPYGTYDNWGPFAVRDDWRQDNTYLHEVALLIRDASTGKTLYETRASSGGRTRGGDRLTAAMFDASMKDFPRANGQPHDVRMPLQKDPSV